jgi:hypothetical protein
MPDPGSLKYYPQTLLHLRGKKEVICHVGLFTSTSIRRKSGLLHRYNPTGTVAAVRPRERVQGEFVKPMHVSIDLASSR